MKIKGIPEVGYNRIARCIRKNAWADDDDMWDLSADQAKASALNMLQTGDVDGMIRHIEKHDEYVKSGGRSNRNYLGFEDFVQLASSARRLWEVSVDSFRYLLLNMDGEIATDIAYNIGTDVYDRLHEWEDMSSWYEYYMLFSTLHNADEHNLISLKNYIDANPEIAAEQNMEEVFQEGLSNCPDLQEAVDAGEELNLGDW